MFELAAAQVAPPPGRRRRWAQSVPPAVLGKRGRVSKGCRAQGAGQRLGSGVKTGVNGEVLFGEKGLAAGEAGVRPLTRVRQLMRAQGLKGGEGSWAEVT